MEKVTQKAKLLAYLTEYVSVTPLVARHVLGIERLAARIYDLKKDGVKVNRRITRDFTGQRFTIYSLEV